MTTEPLGGMTSRCIEGGADAGRVAEPGPQPARDRPWRRSTLDERLSALVFARAAGRSEPACSTCRSDRLRHWTHLRGPQGCGGPDLCRVPRRKRGAQRADSLIPFVLADEAAWARVARALLCEADADVLAGQPVRVEVWREAADLMALAARMADSCTACPASRRGWSGPVMPREPASYSALRTCAAGRGGGSS